MSDKKTIVELKHGSIEGSYEDGLYVYKGIPFAAPPVGEFRWLPPQPVRPWEGVRRARSFGPIAPQITNQPSSLQEPGEHQSEDCLYLNIWSPGLDGPRRPVMVWIHGGAFKIGSGSNPAYHGKNLAKRGNVVVVSINYRLGPLGFLRLKEITGDNLPATGNEGLLDQITALQWVRENISSFGGNPENVTVFGESAGAMSIGCLLAMPLARGLFHKAILQSGSNTVKYLDESARIAELFLEILGLSATDVNALTSISAEKLLAAQQELGIRLNVKGSVFEPVVDGELLPEMPIDAVKHGSARGIALLAGTNLEEARFMARADESLTNVDFDGLVKRWQQIIPPELAPGLIDDYRKIMSRQGKGGSASEVALALQTAVQFRIPGIRLVEAQSRNGLPAYSYLFTWKSPAPGMGACHTLEIGFVFGELNARFHGTGEAADRLARQVRDAWLAFASSGDPGCEGLGSWPRYGNRRVTMILGKDSHPEEAPYDEERRAWDPVPDRFLG